MTKPKAERIAEIRAEHSRNHKSPWPNGDCVEMEVQIRAIEAEEGE